MSLDLPLDMEPAVRHPMTPPPGTPLPPHFQRCFGCGPDHPTGLHMKMVAGEGPSVAGVMLVTDNHQGAMDLIHGGVLSAAFDEALGYMMWTVGRVGVTAHLETDFKRPVPVGTELHITATCIGTHGRKIYATGEAHLGSLDGELCATAAAIFVTVGAEHFARHGSGGVSDGEWRSNP